MADNENSTVCYAPGMIVNVYGKTALLSNQVRDNLIGKSQEEINQDIEEKLDNVVSLVWIED